MLSIIAVLAVLAGSSLLLLATRERQKALAATHWPTTWGIVRASSVVLQPGGGPVSYAASVQYDYVVGDRTYHGSCISDGLRPEPGQSHPAAQVLRYSTGSVAQVRHHPDDPSRAVLEVHPRGAGVAIGSLGALLFAVGAVFGLMSFATFLTTVL